MLRIDYRCLSGPGLYPEGNNDGSPGAPLGSIGLDIVTGLPKFTFGIDELTDGVGIGPIAMGLFGIAEIFVNLEENLEDREVFQTRIGSLWPSLKDWVQAKWAIARGTVVGFFLGILPGGGALLSSFVSYAVEKKVAKNPERFGKGAIEGVAGPESANNAATGGSFIPLLSLGIPSTPTMALLFSMLVIHGVRPGPLFIKDHPDIFWGLIASMYLGNVFLIILNLPLVGIWVKVLKIPYRILFPLILLFCLIGAYSINNSTFDVSIMILFGVVGYLMRKFGYEGAPLILAFVLGPIMEQALRQSLLISKGSFMIFIARPISGITLAVAALLLLSACLPYIKKRRTEFKELKEE